MGHRLVGLLFLLAGALACGDGADDDVVEGCPTTPVEGDFRLVVKPDRLDLYRGESATIQVWAMERGECAAEVEISIRGLPPGVSATSKTLGPDQTAALLQLSVDQDAALVASDVEIDARSPSSFRTHLLPFNVRATGDPIESFGDGGMVQIQETDDLIDVALDEQGRVYLLLRPTDARDHVRLTRILADGAVDTGFLSERLPSQSMPTPKSWRLAIDAEQNRIYVAGRRGKGTVIHAVGESGRREKTFGTDGELVVDWANELFDMRIHPGALRIGGLDGQEFFLAVLDPTGRILSRAEGIHAGSWANAGLVQDDGLILLKTSSIWDGAVDAEVMISELFRYRASDSVADPSFGQEGVGTQRYVEYGSLQPGPSGALYACGRIQSSEQPHYYFPVIQRWRRDGIVDGSFGFGGRGMSESAEFGLRVCSGIAPSPSGIVMLIQRWGAEPNLIQFGTDGKQDMRFGTSGVARLPSSAPAVINQNDHAGIVVAQGEESKIVITRLHP